MKPKVETLRHREAFETYYNLGKDRSTQAVSKQYRVSHGACQQWSVAFKWSERVIQRDKKIADGVEKENNASIIEAKSRQLQISIAVQSLYAKALKRLQEEGQGIEVSPSEIVKVMAHEMKLLGDKAFIDPGISVNNPTINIQKEKSLIAVFGQMLPEQKEKIMLALGRLGNGDGVLA